MITAETVNGIVRFEANGLPVVSLYCGVDPGESQRELRARVDSLLDQIRPLAEDGDFDPRHRLSVRADTKRIKDATSSERWPPGTIAIFSCSGRDLYEEIPLPRRVPEQVMVDAPPLARPMLAVLGEYCRACVVVLDRESSRVWEMYLDEVREVETVTDPPHKAGNTESRPEDRTQNRVDEQTKRHFRRVARVIDQLLRTGGYDVLVAGGHEHELPEFLRLGLQECLWAGSMSAIETLLVRDGPAVPGVVCDGSRWLAASGELCPVCGNHTRYTPDVLDELAAVGIGTGGSARQIAADLMSEEYLAAAELRFSPPPPDQGS
jgi:hypothetical protein